MQRKDMALVHDGVCSEGTDGEGTARVGPRVPSPGKRAQSLSGADACGSLGPPSLLSGLAKLDSAARRGGAVRRSFVFQKSYPGFRIRGKAVSGCSGPLKRSAPEVRALP